MNITIFVYTSSFSSNSSSVLMVEQPDQVNQTTPQHLTKPVGEHVRTCFSYRRHIRNPEETLAPFKMI